MTFRQFTAVMAVIFVLTVVGIFTVAWWMALFGMAAGAVAMVAQIRAENRRWQQRTRPRPLGDAWDEEEGDE